MEEKETDVNIALQIVLDAEDDLYDRMILVSADTDLVPAIKKIQERHPDKEITVYAPPTKNKMYNTEFIKTLGKINKINLKQAMNSLFKNIRD